MRALLIGGTGLISAGIVKHLLARGAEVTMFNRGQRQGCLSDDLAAKVKKLAGDRNDVAAFEKAFADQRFDVVIDMICFKPEQAESDVRAFAGRCGQFIFCSTVCTYGTKIPPGVVVDESFPQEPASAYGRNKLACEQVFLKAHEAGQLNVTVVRPSHTYGPGGSLIDNLESNPPTWDRIEKGLPVICTGDGLGLWNSTHRDDVGKLFAYAAGNPKTFGQAYNATRQEVFTWRDYYREAAAALGKTAQLLFLPARFVIPHAPERFALLKEITHAHGAYTSAKAMLDVPEFRCDIGFVEGARQTLASAKQRGAWKRCEDDAVYEKLVEAAKSLGVEPVEA